MTRTIDTIGTWGLLAVVLFSVYFCYGWHVVLWVAGSLFLMAAGGSALFPDREGRSEE